MQKTGRCEAVVVVVEEFFEEGCVSVDESGVCLDAENVAWVKLEIALVKEADADEFVIGDGGFGGSCDGEHGEVSAGGHVASRAVVEQRGDGCDGQVGVAVFEHLFEYAVGSFVFVGLVEIRVLYARQNAQVLVRRDADADAEAVTFEREVVDVRIIKRVRGFVVLFPDAAEDLFVRLHGESGEREGEWQSCDGRDEVAELE